ncbi:MAG: S8 family serine peptidase [Firmicutes bacterium]|nr:S8 family serine peptidase [Bacillota bacterium]
MKKLIIIAVSVVVVTFLPVLLVAQNSFDTMYSLSNATSRLEEIINDREEQILFEDVELEDRFSDKEILVTLSAGASFDFRELAPRDFPEVALAKVECVTPGLESAKMQVYAISSRNLRMQRDLANDSWQIDLSIFRRLLSLHLQYPGKENVLRAVSVLRNRGDVISANPSFYGSLSPISYTEESVAPQSAGSSPWYMSAIEAVRARELALGPNIRVGVLDTGIDASHPSLRNRLYRGHFEWGRPYADLFTDPEGHGTSVAGIIGAESSGSGMAVGGVARDIQLISLRIVDSNGNWGWGSAIRAINHAQYHGIPILNLSGGADYGPWEARRAIELYRGLFIASTGGRNSNSDNQGNESFPANFRLPNLISVGASNSSDGRSRWGGVLWIGRGGSNYGVRTVDVFAPGSDIRTTRSGGGVIRETGTSFAAPFVAGVAAIMLSLNIDITPSEKRNIILSSVDRNTSLENISVSGGRLNAYLATRRARGGTNPWPQPRWAGPTLSGHGTISASGTYRNEVPWRAFNGTMYGGSGGNGDNWSVNARTGYLELRLDYFITIHSIEVWGNTSAGNNRTREANFTAGINGVPLGLSFELANQNHAHHSAYVGGVRTNVVRLNIISSYGNWVGVSRIRIHATQDVQVVTSAQQLYNIRGNRHGNFRLGANINMADLGRQWNPIPYFHGTLDGNGHTIHGMTIAGRTVAQTGRFVGLVGVNYGVIRNLNMTGVNIRFDFDTGRTWSDVGAVAGVNRARGVINNVVVSASNIQVHRPFSTFGGIVGRNIGAIAESQVGNTVLYGNGDIGGVAGANYWGGVIAFVGVDNLDIRYFMAYERRAIGGIVGWHTNAEMHASHNRRNSVTNSNIRVVGQRGAAHHAPLVGIVVGGVNDSVIMFNHGANSHLHNQANLTASQLVNFGRSPGWPWAGQVWGNSTVWSVPDIVLDY